MDASRKGLAEIVYKTFFNINDEVVFHDMIFFCRYISLVAQSHLVDDGHDVPFH